MASSAGRLRQVVDTLHGVADVLADRAERVAAPEWCTTRAWTGFLRELSDGELAYAEAQGLGALLASRSAAPSDLRALALACAQLTQLPRLGTEPLVPSQTALKAVNARKQRQLGVLLGALQSMAAHATRIVDVGAGHGHLTRLVADFFARDALGIERSAERVQVATRRAERAQGAAPAGGVVRFALLDACREPLAFGAGDLAVGLHACGELGDRLVEASGQGFGDLALVSCCLQKIEAPLRRPLSSLGAELILPRHVLGLANLTAQTRGVEASLSEMLAARTCRYALRRLLTARGLTLEPGAEMRGINRRRAHAGLALLAAEACQLHELEAPTSLELDHYQAEAHAHQVAIRRWALPRHMLSRLLEMAVALDRAHYLEEQGFEVRLLEVFEAAVSPRNIGLFASRDGLRLPAVSAN